MSDGWILFWAMGWAVVCSLASVGAFGSTLAVVIPGATLIFAAIFLMSL